MSKLYTIAGLRVFAVLILSALLNIQSATATELVGENIQLLNINDWGGGFIATFEYVIDEKDVVDDRVRDWRFDVDYLGGATLSQAWMTGYAGTIKSGLIRDNGGYAVTNKGVGYRPELEAGDRLVFNLHGSGTGFSATDFRIRFNNLTQLPGNTFSSSFVGVDDWYNPSWGGGFNATFRCDIEGADVPNGPVTDFLLSFNYTGSGTPVSAWSSTHNGPIEHGFIGPDGGYAVGNRVGFQPELWAGDSITFTIQIQDAGFAPDDFTIHCGTRGDSQTSPNTPPVALDQNLRVVAGDALAVVLEARDAEDDVLSYIISQKPANGTLTGAAPNLTYTAAPGYSGTDQFSFDVTDSALVSSTGTVSVDVIPPLVVAQSSLTVAEDTNGSLVLSVEGEQPEELAFIVVAGSAHGDTSLVGRTLTYVPVANYFGTDSITVSVSDGERTSAPRTIPIEVTPVNDAPIFVGLPPAQHTVSRTVSSARPIELSGWKEESYIDYDTGGANPDWSVESATGRIVQRSNSDPTIYLSPDVPEGIVVRGKISVETTADDDFIGFVFGFEDRNSFFLLDWKQGTQTWNGREAVLGLALKRFDIAGDEFPDFWPTVPSNGEVLYRGATSWTDGVSYDFSIALVDNLIHVSIEEDGQLVDAFSIEGEAVPAGRFGFYNFSQSDVIYEGLESSSLTSGDWQYTLDATDVDGDQLTYTLLEAPTGLVLDPETGKLEWSLGADSVGEHPLLVEVSDTNGGRGQVRYVLQIRDDNPLVVSNPVQRVAVGEDYAYRVVAFDTNENDSLFFSLIEGPDGLSIDVDSGQMAWTTQSIDVGIHPVQVMVTDVAGNQVFQSFEVEAYDNGASSNTAPVIENKPPSATAIRETLRHRVIASDADGDSLSYTLIEGPSQMRIEQDGTLLWTPVAYGERTFRIRVSDGISSTDQAWVVGVVDAVDVADPVVPLSAQLSLSSTRVAPLTSLDVTIQPAGGIGEYAVQVSIDGQLIAIDAPFNQSIDAPATPGIYDVVVTVSDTSSSIVLESTLEVVAEIAPNTPPVFIADPVQTALLGIEFEDRVQVSDPDGDTLVYSLLQAPADMTLDVNGELRWTPQSVGAVVVLVSVTDGTATIERQWSLTVIPPTDTEVPPHNNPPQFTGQPLASVTQGQMYNDRVLASDPDGDALSYTLLVGPSGMMLDATGELSWSPQNAGVFSVRIGVSDGSATIERAWQIAVVPSVPPSFGTEPPRYARVGIAYRHQFDINNAGTLPLNYTLVDAPPGVSISSEGLLEWTPDVDGLKEIVVALDYDVGRLEQRWTIDVRAASDTLTLSLSITPEIIELGDTVLVVPTTIGAAGPFTLTAMLDGVALDVDTDGAFSFVAAQQPGLQTLTVSIEDALERVEITESIVVEERDDASGGSDGGTGSGSGGGVSDGVAPRVSLSDTLVDAVVRSPVDVRGSVDDDTLASWRIELLASNAEPRLIASGDTPIVDGVLATLDPTVLTNGARRLRLVATDSDGMSSYEEISLVIDGAMKVGNFSFSVQDLSIPMAGIPITLNRTYDSRRRHEALDFGYGWSVDYQNVSVDESRTPGAGWALNEYVTGPLGALKDFCVEPIGKPQVTVTLPDGQVESFSIAAMPNCNLVPILDVSLVFQPESGTRSTLEALNAQSGRLNVGAGTISLAASGQQLDPSRYELTTQAGFVYTLDQSFGIEQITDPNGHTLTYSDSGIVHSAGKRIDFIRDEDGRIIEISDPAGNLISYDYSPTGDLVSVMDRAFASTDFTYNNNHGLLDIIDPLGRRVVRNLYDDDGRLIAQEDNDGKRTEFAHDIDGRQSVVTDRLGRTTFLYYDERGNVTSTVDALGNISTTTFDENDNPLSQTNALGHTTTMSWDDQDNQLSQSNPLGHTVNYTYNALGRETQIGDELGRVYNNTYDSVGNLLSIEDPDGNTAGNNINAQGLVTLQQDMLGNQSTYEYDAEGNKTKETDATGAVTTYTYDDNNNQLKETRTRTIDGTAVSETSTNTYNARDQLTRTTDALGYVTRFEYDLKGQETAQIDARGQRTTMAYDAYGRLTETTYPDGAVSSHTYDAEGNKLTDTDPLGRTTTYTYDALNRVINTVYPDGARMSSTFDAAGRMTSSTDQRGNTSRYEYDAANRRTAVVDALGNRHAYAYDAAGNITSETDARGNTVNYSYNNLDQRTQVTHADATRTQDTLDALGRRTQMHDEASVTTDYGYDELGRLTSVTDAAGNTTSYSYDEAGNKLTQTDAQGRTTSWTYDALGRVSSRTLPLGQIETFGYDANGNQIRHTDFNGDTHRFVYDNTDRMTEARYADGSVTIYDYDAIGNRTRSTINDTAGTRIWQYRYDARDRLIEEVKPDGSLLSYQYDAAGNKTRLQVTLAVGTVTTINYFYDELNRLASVSNSDGTSTYGYDEVGNRTSLSYPNNTTQRWEYDTRNHLIDTAIYNAQGVKIQSFDYTLDATGRRTRITELDGRTSDFTYSALYWLTAETITDSVNGNHSASFTYDNVGNRIQVIENGITTAYRYDDNDRLAQHGGVIYTYDANGNTLEENDQGLVTRYGYNSQNQMIEHSALGITTAYQYNPDGIRHGQSDSISNTGYLVDANRDYAQVLAEDVDGTIMARYHFGDDLISQQRSGDTRYFHTDGLGSTRILSDASGTSTDRYAYSAFGELLSHSGTTDTRYLYTGEQFDEGLDQYYLRARYYDQGAGRFTQMDTWMGKNQDPVTLHKYAYGNLDPQNVTDPTGHFGLASFGAANSIRAELSSMQVDIGMSLLDTAFNTDGAAQGQTNSLMLGVASIGGAGAFKLMRMLSSKFRKVCGGNSFTGDTLVSTENGLEPIDQIVIGDRVWAYDEETGENTLQEVIHLIAGEGEKSLVDITLASGEVISATVGHPMYSASQSDWVDAGELTLDDVLREIGGAEASIVGLRKYSEIADVYNLTVANDHTYFVGVDEVLGHNAGCGNNAFYSILDKKLKTKYNRLMQQASAGGNKGITGKLNVGEVTKLGMAFVGEDYRVTTSRKVRAFVSNDGMRVFTFPTSKKGVNPVSGKPWSSTGFQANFETKNIKGVVSNVHVDVIK